MNIITKTNYIIKRFSAKIPSKPISKPISVIRRKPPQSQKSAAITSLSALFCKMIRFNRLSAKDFFSGHLFKDEGE